MNLGNLGVQEMNAKELNCIEGGGFWDFVEGTVTAGLTVGLTASAAYLNAGVDAAQWGLGVLAGMGDGITAGLED